MPRKKTKPSAQERRTLPLSSKQDEAFVREYQESYDAPQAALHAGFDTPHIIGPKLLERTDIQARLRGYEAGIDGPAHSVSGISKHLLQSALTPRKPDLVPDLVTGQMRPDWELINEQDSNFVEYEEIVQYNGGIPKRSTRLRKRPNFDAIRTVAQHLEALVQNSGQSNDVIKQVIMDINRRGSAAPIATEVRRLKAAAIKLGEDKAEDT